ncbi:flagellar hook-associated protein FlgL [Miltoncostaea oceani]|uniref:flagellar hook-associated protein FlgL n=1 Tax=Miltoncostaea oceani TaxID=2843216 RepID=UPI001C3D3F5B|nr:flagellar hook-associated protein FlgL [Miltoncostaea oceani]
MSTGQMTRNFLADLEGNYRSLADSQRQVSTGKRILTPSDDPVGIAIALGLRRDQKAGEAWGRNIDDSLTWMNTTDRALGQALEVAQRARELAVQGGNGTLSAESRALIAAEVDSLKSQFVEIGNSSIGGRYIFGGTATDRPPFDPATETAAAPVNTSLINREVAQGSVISVNITADRLQDPPGATADIFTVLDDLSNSLRTSDFDGITRSLGALDAHQDNISALRGEQAAKVNRLELTASRFEAQKIATGDQLSRIEDVDMAQAITDLTMKETVYRSALAAGARVIQPSLVDFLR